MKKDELNALCKEHKINDITGKSKKELIEMIKQRDDTQVSTSKNMPETDVKVEHIKIHGKNSFKNGQIYQHSIANKLKKYVSMRKTLL